MLIFRPRKDKLGKQYFPPPKLKMHKMKIPTSFLIRLCPAISLNLKISAVVSGNADEGKVHGPHSAISNFYQNFWLYFV